MQLSDVLKHPNKEYRIVNICSVVSAGYRNTGQCKNYQELPEATTALGWNDKNNNTYS